MSGDRGKPPADWRAGLKDLRARLPSQAPKAAAKAAPKPSREAAAQPAPPPPSPVEEAELFEREVESQGVARGESAGLGVDADVSALPHASGPAAGESRVAEPDHASGRPRLKGDRRALARQLDLHGMSLDDATSSVKTFLSQHRDLGGKEVLIVTGHGQRRAGGGILRSEIEALLLKHPHVERADPEGTGAFRVTLRSRRP